MRVEAHGEIFALSSLFLVCRCWLISRLVNKLCSYLFGSTWEHNVSRCRYK